ncbi:Nucleolar protein 9, partial [Serendipita sp. 400]
MDRILVGMISGYSATPESIPPPSDYLATLLRDATASHLLETVVQHMPDGPFSQLWRVYFSGKLHRLAIHPVANFVVANAFERLNNNDFPEAVQEMEKVLAKSFKQHRIGPVTSLVKRAGAIKVSEDEVINAICMALGIDVNEPVGLIERILVTEGTADGQTNGEEQATTSQAPPSVQGALLLQAMLLLSAPHNEVVIRSFELMSKQTKIALAHDPTSSRVIDAMLESPVVTRKGKRGVIMGYLGQYEQLVDDRIGSRVGDRCWIHADPYLKEKIARSLIPHQQTLAASYYGKFFAKKLQLSLLLRKPDEWRVAQVQSGEKMSQFDATNNHYNHERIPNPDTNTSKPRKNGKRDDDVAAASSLKKQATAENETIIDMDQDEEVATAQDASAHKSEKTKRGRKRKREEGLDEIDVLFSGVKENRFSKVSSSNAVTDEVKQEGKSGAVSRSEDLDNVLKAI